MEKLLTARDLDATGCQVPNCTHAHERGEPLMLHARCHPAAGLEVSYDKGIMTVTCKQDHRLVCHVQVASGD